MDWGDAAGEDAMSERLSTQQRGFTLLEVLVAMAIVAVALMGLVRMASSSVDNSTAMRERSLALWVAQNRIVHLRMQQAWPSPGDTAGEVEMGGQHWQWRQNVSKTPDAKVRKVSVRVHDEAGRSRNLLVAYLVRPL